MKCGDRCVDVQGDPLNCGDCGRACPTFAGADTQCNHGRCALVCHGTTSNCDGDVSNGCETPLSQCHKRVFVSSATYTGNLGGLAAADARCQSLADAATLGGQYKAWLSDEKTSAKDRLTHSEDNYVLPSGTLVAINWDALVSFNVHPIDQTETGQAPSATPGIPIECGSAPAAMTGTWGTGEVDPGATCNSWTTDAPVTWVGYGSTDQGSSLWTAHCAALICNVAMHLYCFEQ